MMYESTGPKKYRLVMLVFGGAWTVGTWILVLVAYIVPKWRTLGVALAILHAFIVFLIYKCPESPRWFYKKFTEK